MKISETKLTGAFTIEPAVHGDNRGHFFEGFNRKQFIDSTGSEFDVFQVNHSRSKKHILRGLHFQVENQQSKLIWVTSGEIFDVIVDLRRSSSWFGDWYGVELSCKNRRRLYVPKGFAHGFLVTSDFAEVTYLTSDIYNPAAERFLRWNCPQIDIRWPTSEPILNERDAAAPGLKDCETFE